jgi:hypothetical protein
MSDQKYVTDDVPDDSSLSDGGSSLSNGGSSLSNGVPEDSREDQQGVKFRPKWTLRYGRSLGS